MLQDAYLVNTLEQISTYIISPLALSTTTWMDLGDTVQSERNQTQKEKYCIISPTCRILKIFKTHIESSKQ